MAKTKNKNKSRSAGRPADRPNVPTATPTGPSTFRQKPVRSALSKYAIATLIQKEAKNIGELAETMETDYQVKLAQATIYANIYAIPTEVKSTGTDPRATLLADQLERLWKIHLSDMLECFGRGRVAFEKVLDYNEQANCHFVRKLEPLPFSHTEMMLEPGTGRFIGIALRYGKSADGSGSSMSSSSKAETLEIPQPNSWWLALDPTPTQPHGRSRHNGAPYTVYQERQHAIRLRRIFIQKMVLMGGVAHVPDQIMLENGQSLDTFAEMARAHDDRMAGGMMILSNKRDAGGEYEFNIEEQPSTLTPEPLDTHIDGLDQDQLQAYSIPPKVVIEGDAVGSFAMVSIQRLILDALIEHILGQMERSFQKYVIDKVVEANFAPDSGVTLKISHEPLLDQSNQIMAQVVKAILTSPQLPGILASGIVDVQELLKSSRIPLLPGAKEAIQKLFDQAKQQAAQAQTAQGAAGTLGSGHKPPPNGNGNLPHPPGQNGTTPSQNGNSPPNGAARFSNEEIAERFLDFARFFNPNHGKDGKFDTAQGGIHRAAVAAIRSHILSGNHSVQPVPEHLLKLYPGMPELAHSADLIGHMKRINPHAGRGGMVGANELRAAVGDSLNKEEFDGLALGMAKHGKLSLHRHDFVSPLSDQERAELIHDPNGPDYGHNGTKYKGTFYSGVAIRQPDYAPAHLANFDALSEATKALTL